jgi:ABC-type cobalamin/Fe3+-siderophores transport system ATPase subunit
MSSMHQDGHLKFIIDWINNPTSQQNILWLHGLAGSGKSTLSTTIASIFADSGNLGAFLFFDRDDTEGSDPALVIKTLAYQLATSDTKLGAAIRTVLEKNSNIVMSPLRLQFHKLLLDEGGSPRKKH